MHARVGVGCVVVNAREWRDESLDALWHVNALLYLHLCTPHVHDTTCSTGIVQPEDIWRGGIRALEGLTSCDPCPRRPRFL